MSEQMIEVNPDDHVDNEIASCLNLQKPKSFLLFAGAGSGKTRSLVNVLKVIRNTNGEFLRLRNRQIAVITYTNAACDEIKNRLGQDALFHVSTIHSFIWDLIRPFQNDIREWVKNELDMEIRELETEVATTKNKTTKTFLEKQRKLESRKRRTVAVDSVISFSYNPNGENRGRDSLNHSEVIKMGAFFINEKELMKSILVQKYPMLLIDESQDTNKYLLDAFMTTQIAHANVFAIGLFGDMMQRIYFDGKANLRSQIPDSWAKPIKVMNYRCPQRVRRLINQIRKDVDGIEQRSPVDKEEGVARLFIIKAEGPDKNSTEVYVREKMASICKDPKWSSTDADVKILALEHHMAASRMGFFPFYAPLQKVDRYKTGLLDGTIPGLGIFLKRILPMILAHRSGNEFALAQVVKDSCPLLDRKNLRNTANRSSVLAKVQSSVDTILALWDSDADPILMDVLKAVNASNIFEIPAVFEPLLTSTPAMRVDNAEDDSNPDEELAAWNETLKCPFSMLERYASYVSGTAHFGTHQGIKALEFQRVMVIIDDEEAKGFMFSYDKLFGVKAKTKTDIENERDGKETGIERTTRLIYVTCSRAEQSLAIVAYSPDPSVVKQFAIDKQWFAEDEIEVIA